MSFAQRRSNFSCSFLFFFFFLFCFFLIYSHFDAYLVLLQFSQIELFVPFAFLTSVHQSNLNVHSTALERHQCARSERHQVHRRILQVVGHVHGQQNVQDRRHRGHCASGSGGHQHSHHACTLLLSWAQLCSGGVLLLLKRPPRLQEKRASSDPRSLPQCEHVP